MNNRHSTTLPSEWQRSVAKSLDETLHTQMAKTSMGLSPISMVLAYTDWALHLAASPGRQMLLGQRAVELAHDAVKGALQNDFRIDDDGKPVTEKDTRFCNPGWHQWPFNVIKEGFKASDAWWRESTQVDGVSPHHGQIVNFFTGQGLDALSPSNWAATNPEVLQKGESSLGQSWLKGYQSYLKDVLRYQHAHASNDVAAIKPLKFEVGKDVALTPGKVVFRNHLIELIQYTPTTETVYPEPLLIVPSCIMKYYILDLSPANSMVRYLVDKGHTVFMVSWCNPDASDRAISMQDYLETGVMEAMAAVKAQTAVSHIHAIGYCLGGTFLAIVAAILSRHDPHSQHQGQDRRRRYSSRDDAPSLDRLPALATVTLLAAQTDFSEPGQLGTFIDDDQLKTLRETMARTGYLSGQQMGGSFQLFNARDLIWSRNMRRYLLGEEEETGNDMTSWNEDVTRLPERMHSEYLTSLFLNNELTSGHYHFGGEGVALMDIKAPMFVVGTARDQVSPWRSVYKIHLFTDTHMTFILASGGHNAGIVSEPGHRNRRYQMESVEGGHGWIEPNEWEADATMHEGSWWEAMHIWLHERSGLPVIPPVINPNTILCEAPGEYVMVRYAD